MSFQLIQVRQVTNMKIDTMILDDLITDHQDPPNLRHSLGIGHPSYIKELFDERENGYLKPRWKGRYRKQIHIEDAKSDFAFWSYGLNTVNSRKAPE